MGKMKNNNPGAVKQGEQCQSTVFISNLPYSFTTPQLEETFSQVGPIRRCFMVTQKGSTEHRGFAFVQFAASEDADRAIEIKNGTVVGGRKVAVKHANPRASLKERREKANYGAQSRDTEDMKVEKDDDTSENHEEIVKNHKEVAKGHKEVTKGHTEVVKDHKELVKGHKEVVKDLQERVNGHKEVVKDQKQAIGKPSAPRKAKGLCVDLVDAENHSGKQRVARTVIIGGLMNADMVEEALLCAKEIDGVCSVKYPLPKEELELNGLTQDGCEPEAAAVLYASVRSARAAVAKLHGKEIKEDYIWARQLGGEGSKTQKWKLIVHNLPFRATVDELREKFSLAGFVWDVSIPQNPETEVSKGFAFVKFTSKQDAERAIQKLNGLKFGKRTIAVDWAISKKLYASGVNSAVMSEEGKQAESVAGSESDSDDSSEHDVMEKVGEDSNELDTAPDDSELAEDKATESAAVDFEEEAKLAQRVLQNLLMTSNKGTSSIDNPSAPPQKNPDSKKSAEAQNTTTDGSLKKSSQSKPENTAGDDELQKTIFISNIPFEAGPEEVKQRFSSFGEVKYFAPVLHKVTGRPRGTGFLKFIDADAVSAAVSAANVGPGLGITLQGRQLTVLKALDKKSANDKAVEKSKTEEIDRRNLYLAKEGLILEGTPAAEGVSVSDLEKRQGLERMKMVKLKSPNFHVSRTRLIMYNLPKSLNFKELKKICINAVTSREVKQTPVIHQLKFLKDAKNGKVTSKNYSRGVAFVEFSEHEHALVALRVLNNNPETFGPEHRPIVEFALDNIQTLRQRNLKMQNQQQTADEGIHAGKQGEHKLPDSSAQLNNKSNSLEDTKKRKPCNKKGNLNPNPSNDVGNQSEPAYAREDDRGTNKKQRRMDLKKKNDEEIKKPKPSKDQTQKPKKHEPQESKFKKNTQETKRPVQTQKKVVETHEQPNSMKKSNKRKVRDDVSNAKAEGGFLEKRPKSGKNKDPLGRDTVDKLDMLIEQYRSKFAQRDSEKAAGGARPGGGSKQIRRWFQ